MVLRLALLVCDTLMPAVVEAHGNHPEIYDTWLKASNVAGVPYQLTPFDVVNHPEVYPNPEEIDAVILTGSGSNFHLPIIETNLTCFFRQRPQRILLCRGYKPSPSI